MASSKEILLSSGIFEVGYSTLDIFVTSIVLPEAVVTVDPCNLDILWDSSPILTLTPGFFNTSNKEEWYIIPAFLTPLKNLVSTVSYTSSSLYL